MFFLNSDRENAENGTDNNNSRAINIGKSVKISYQLSTWSSVGIKEFIAAESIKYYSQSV